jgi:hypothetical protein
LTISAAATSAAEEALRSAMSARIVVPSDPDYDGLRSVMYGGFDLRPALIVRVRDAAEVAAAIRAARESDLPLAIRGGGHSNAGHSVVDGGIVIDLREMTGLEIDVEGRTAWAETGLTAGDVSNAAAAHGLAIGFGDTASVGIGGITLGGGVGYLARKFGLAIDNLLAADIVTADGRVLRASAEDHPDLFWAIRGGGGNFGVATRFQYRLQPLDGIVGGILVLPASEATIAGFIAAAEAAPDDMTTIANVMPAPPMPFIPEALHGQTVIFASLAWAGAVEEGEPAVAPFRALATPLLDMVRPMSYSELFPPEDESYHPTAVSINLFIDHVDTTVDATILRFLADSDSSLRVAQIRVLGGATARVPVDATAYAHRRSPIMVNVANFIDGPDDRPRRQAWADSFAAALNQGDDGAYVNFLSDEGEARVRAAYPHGAWERLAEIKAIYDPTNHFRRNQNIPPANGPSRSR